MSDPGSSVSDVLSGAAEAFADFANGPVANTTATIESAVARSFGSVTRTIANAAKSGSDSIAQLTNAVLADFDRIAASQFIAKPVESLVSSVVGSLVPISGARATGGPVSPGASYLVGEAGPELFTPAGNGQITSNAALPGARASQVVVNITTPDAQSFQKSKSQIAAMMARALAQGNRNL